jgi:hypothetical protein
MRITDDRYTRDRLKFDLAMRLIRHEARTRTIRAWTGLSDDRIRKLFRTYVAEHGQTALRRHRGKAPRQPAWFLRNAESRRHAASLGALFCSLGLVQRAATPPGSTSIADLRWCEDFCRAYEEYAALLGAGRMSFEHACFLRTALERQAELCVEQCQGCGGLVVISPYAVAPTSCEFCARLRGSPRASH